MPHTDPPLTLDLGASTDGTLRLSDFAPARGDAPSPDPVGAVDPGVPPDLQILAKNLAALAKRQPGLAKRLGACTDPSPASFEVTEEDGALTATLGARALASRRRPLTEGARLAQQADLDAHGAFVVLGMGLGYHAGALVERAGDTAAVLIFEPDLALLRAVLERIDHSAWLARPTSVIITNPDDVGALTADMQGLEPLISVGVEFVDHAPNRARLGDSVQRLSKSFASAVSAMRMHVITAMVQSDITVRNELMNVGHYAARPGIAELEGLCAGRPAILVAAGPSLKRSIELLKDPRVRERCVIIAVQTVLRPLLDAGIRPHFVTAIDHHEISRRFYEGLVPGDVDGVTLIAEARANASILDAFPGDMRLPRDDFLDDLLETGPKHDGPDRGKLTAAATVAHLNHYLARWLGCDPVVLVGQDLAFTDAQYYGPGAAIHNVWACELNEMHTLETLEWQRIVRNKGHLHRVTDQLGRPVYTDDQMATYLAQFERDFAEDVQRGLSVIDASDGVQKRHTSAKKLEEVLGSLLRSDTPPVPEIPRAIANDEPSLRRAVADRLRRVRTQVRTIGRTARECVSVLEQLKDQQHDQAKNRDLVRKTHALRQEAESQQPGFHLLMKLNQLGGFKRFKADRAIELAKHQDQLAEQRARIDRDIVNLAWIDEYAELFEDLLRVAERAIHGGEKRTRDIVARETSQQKSATNVGLRTGAVIHADMGTGRADHLRATVGRLRASKRLDDIVVLASEPQRWGDIDGAAIVRTRRVDADTMRALRAGRALALDNWRGGLAGLSVWDEVIEPASMLEACNDRGIDSLLAVGPDWVALDPALTDRVIERHTESPQALPMVFSQAPPGVSPAVLSRGVLKEIADGRTKDRGSMFASLGGVLGYVPMAPRHDPIARPECVQIDDRLRDAGVRTIADIDPDLVRIAVDGGPDTIGAVTALRAGVLADGTPTEHVIDAAKLARPDAERGIASFAQRSPMGLVTLIGLDVDLLTRARDAGLLVHVRTDLRDYDEALLHADIVSVDCVSTRRNAYARLTGVDALEDVLAHLERLLTERTFAGGMPTTWVVPRITKRDDTYEDIEAFYDTWLVRAGACVIDPLPAPIAGERIGPLPVPERALERLGRRRLQAGEG
ncbi:MAG: hypothetical protein Tsb0013_11880 [Phycisphaerales bacterium]